jgi:hypothetical protein
MLPDKTLHQQPLHLLGRHFQGSSRAANISETQTKQNTFISCSNELCDYRRLHYGFQKDIFVILHSSLLLMLMQSALYKTLHRGMSYISYFIKYAI